jgi:aryl-alcohol dehydrogenase
MPRPDAVLIKIAAAVICRTKLHARDGYFAMPYPAVYNLQRAGIVAATGSAVEHPTVSDHVAISSPWRGECGHCRNDRRPSCGRDGMLKSRGVRPDGDAAQWCAGLCGILSAILVRRPCADAGARIW